MQLHGILALLSKKSFDRNQQDVATLASWLTEQRGLFSSMPLEVLQLLCTLLRHTQVEEGNHVYKQGELGDCMYVVAKGYCSVSRQLQPQSSTAGIDSQDEARPRSNTADGPNSRSSSNSGGSCSHPVSRRATVEQQTQQFAMATSTVGYPGRRTTQQQAVGAGRQTGEAPQQLQGEIMHIGWVSEGESFGEEALANPAKPRQCSVVAGDGGVLLLLLDRVSISRLQARAQAQQDAAAAAVQCVMAAACRPLLQLPPNKRSSNDVEILAELLARLEAFKRLPQPVRFSLAKSCTSMALPAGAVVFEEDQKGDAMYVIMSGTCQVRARSLKTQNAVADDDAARQDNSVIAPGKTLADGAATVNSINAQGSPSRAGSSAVPASASPSRKATVEGVAAAVSQAAASVAGNQMQPAAAGVLLKQSAIGAPQRTTWEGVAFTAQEQAKLEAVKATLAADKEQGTNSAASSSSDSSAETGGQSRDGLYWTAKFMSDALASASGADPHWDLQGGMTPLAAVFASKWRQQQADKQAVQQQDAVAAAADRAYKAMEDLLGPAAAKAWKAAREEARSSNHSGSGPESSAGQLQGAGSTAAACLDRATSARNMTGSVGMAATAVAAESSTTPVAEGSAAAAPDSQAEHAGAVDAAAEVAESAKETAAYLLAAAALAADPQACLKLQLAALGVKDPAQVSWHLLEEVGARADLDGLLSSVASLVQQQGLPRRLNKKESMKITRQLNKGVLGGASGRGLASSNSSQHQQQQAAASAIPESHISAPGELPPSPETMQQDRRRNNSLRPATENQHDGDDTHELATEPTGMSSYDWRSSVDGSEAASLYGSLDAEGSHWGYGSAAYSVEGGGVANRSSSTSGWGSHSRESAGLAGCRHHTQHKVLSFDEYEQLYGPIIRVMGPGESFGEVALLQTAATRTATVIATPHNLVAAVKAGAEEAADSASPEAVASGGGAGEVVLIRVTRSTYDATVRSLQVSALEELLGFLSSLPPFTGLSRGLLTSLAVFVRPAVVGQGQLLAVAGDKADTLFIIQEGEVKLLDTPVLGIAQQGTDTAQQAPAAGTPPLPRSRRATTGDLPPFAELSARAAGSMPSNNAAAAPKQLNRQTSIPGNTVLGYRRSNVDAGGGAAGHVLAVATSGMSALSLGRVEASATPLAVLGPGSMLGESLLGYDPEQDLLQAVAAVKGHKAREAADAAAAALTHQATAVAVRPCKVLLLNAIDLRRFGRRVRAPLTQLAVDRRNFLQQRRQAVQGTKSSLAKMMADMKQQLEAGAAAASASGKFSRQASNAMAASSMFGRQPSIGKGAAVASRSGTGSKSSNGAMQSSNRTSGSGRGALSSSQGTIPTAAAIKQSSNVRLATSQWQQQQWHQKAYGELVQPAQRGSGAAGASAAAAAGTIEGMTVADIARWRQVVPGDQAPRVSELAAASRPFPADILTATSGASWKSGLATSGKGLQVAMLQ